MLSNQPFSFRCPYFTNEKTVESKDLNTFTVNTPYRQIRPSISEFIKGSIPTDASINFILEDDFNGDGKKEIILGYRIDRDIRYYQVVLYIYNFQGENKYSQLLSTAPETIYKGLGVYDGAYAANTTGDKYPAFILALTAGNGHFVTLLVFHWIDGEIKLVWKSPESFYHGAVYLENSNIKGTFDIVVEYSLQSEIEIISECEACQHIRESRIYRYDGMTYIQYPHQVPLQNQVYNTAAYFLLALWKKDYHAAYKLTMIPYFFGLNGLDDSSLDAFKRYVDREVVPALERNVSNGNRLRAGEPSSIYADFSGNRDHFNFELERDNQGAKVAAIHISAKNQ